MQEDPPDFYWKSCKKSSSRKKKHHASPSPFKDRKLHEAKRIQTNSCLQKFYLLRILFSFYPYHKRNSFHFHPYRPYSTLPRANAPFLQKHDPGCLQLNPHNLPPPGFLLFFYMRHTLGLGRKREEEKSPAAVTIYPGVHSHDVPHKRSFLPGRKIFSPSRWGPPFLASNKEGPPPFGLEAFIQQQTPRLPSLSFLLDIISCASLPP